MLPKLSPDDFGLVRSRRKTALFFLGPRVFPLGPTALESEAFQSVDVAIHTITIKHLAAVDEADATALGFASFARLMDELNKLDPRVHVRDAVTLVHFERPS